tara:strand:- start:1541 stop:2203 length:663 start_codon:yes stop_codon:yes gene_type:complete
MHQTVKNLLNINNQIKTKISELKYNNYSAEIVAVSKTFPISHILPLIDYGHIHFGENKVQEATEKWSEIKIKHKDIKLHMVGRLQTNKVKMALKIFDFIHSLDNLKLAKRISEEQEKYDVKPKLFIQINIGNENQKSGISIQNLQDFFSECKKLDLNIIGTMCLPPLDKDPTTFFSQMLQMNNELKLKELSMGMSEDYLNAVEYYSTYLRIGSKIFGSRN